MALFTEGELRSLGTTRAARVYKSTASLLAEDAAAIREYSSFDVFLSHSFKDAAIILGIKTFLETHGLSVYVDWISDPDLDRGKVNTATADRLRKRMRQSKSLIYAHSNNSPTSKWMSWELGYFDGYRGAVAILPIAETASEGFNGQEFLSLYPFIDKSEAGTFVTSIWVNRGNVSKADIGADEYNFVSFKNWMKTKAGVSIS